jgi:ribonuclease HI
MDFGAELPETTPSTPIKVYCDASYREREDSATAGWCFRTHTGAFIAKHSEDLGSGHTSVSAEVEAAERVLKLIANHAPSTHVMFYSDCQPALGKIDIEQFLGRFDSLTIGWVPRSENIVADMAADNQQQIEREEVETPKFGICD